MYPLKFEPFLRPMIWGGEKIAAYKGVETSVRSIGESWELSGVAGHESIVAEGPCKGVSLPELMDMDVNTAINFCRNMKTVCQKLKVLQQLGLGYLTLGEETPSLSGGEAQRLKLASEIGRTQTDSVFVFDEPTIGLHPLDVRVLLGVFDRLVASGATVVVIEHDLDVIANADWIIDMGPGGGESGGRIVATGTPEQIAANPNSITGRYLRCLVWRSRAFA